VTFLKATPESTTVPITFKVSAALGVALIVGEKATGALFIVVAFIVQPAVGGLV